jgi:hypothetical protein
MAGATGVGDAKLMDDGFDYRMTSARGEFSPL